jgi:hypothetical protein
METCNYRRSEEQELAVVAMRAAYEAWVDYDDVAWNLFSGTALSLEANPQVAIKWIEACVPDGFHRLWAVAVLGSRKVENPPDIPMPDTKHTPEQAEAFAKVGELKRVYYSLQEAMWLAFKPDVLKLKDNPREAFEYISRCMPDTIQKMMLINHFLDLAECVEVDINSRGNEFVRTLLGEIA